MSLKILHRSIDVVPRLARSALPVRGPAQRTFLNLPDLSSVLSAATGSSNNGSTRSGGGPEGDEHSYSEEKILPYTSRELYSVVANVPSYSSFVPFCTGSSIVKSSSTGSIPKISASEPFEVEAELRIGFMNFSEGYVSQVKARPYESVEAVASSTPLFKTLVTTWTFRPPARVANTSGIDPADTGPTLVTLDLRWSFANPKHSLASGMFFGGFSGMMVKAFEKRCLDLYGPRSL